MFNISMANILWSRIEYCRALLKPSVANLALSIGVCPSFQVNSGYTNHVGHDWRKNVSVFRTWWQGLEKISSHPVCDRQNRNKLGQAILRSPAGVCCTLDYFRSVQLWKLKTPLDLLYEGSITKILTKYMYYEEWFIEIITTQICVV